MDLTLNEIEVQKLNLTPGEILVVTIKSDSVTEESAEYLKILLKSKFPNNDVLVLTVPQNDDIRLSIITTDTGE